MQVLWHLVHTVSAIFGDMYLLMQGFSDFLSRVCAKFEKKTKDIAKCFFSSKLTLLYSLNMIFSNILLHFFYYYFCFLKTYFILFYSLIFYLKEVKNKFTCNSECICFQTFFLLLFTKTHFIGYLI